MAKARKVRVKKQGGPWSVEHPETKGFRVALTAGAEYSSDDPVVKAFPWAFEEDNADGATVGVEDATAEPGVKRGAR